MRVPVSGVAPARRSLLDRDGSVAETARGLLRVLAVATTIVMAIVLLQGTLVTNTGSQAGCGNSWPMCQGHIIPELSGVAGAATLIEFSHRAVVPLVSTMIIILAVGLFWYWPRRLEVKILAPAMIVFLLLQAVLGALAVMYPTSASILALHFGISLLAFSSVLLTAAFVLEVGRAEALRDRPLPSGLRWLIWGTFAFTYLQVYLGAYVRHEGASLSCLDWPLCHGSVVPSFSMYGVETQFIHRVGALVLSLLILWLCRQTWRVRASRPDLFAAALAAAVLVVLQAVSGGIVVLSRLAVASTLLHSFLVTLLFGSISYLCYHSLRRPALVVQRGSESETPPSPRPAHASGGGSRPTLG